MGLTGGRDLHVPQSLNFLSWTKCLELKGDRIDLDDFGQPVLGTGNIFSGGESNTSLDDAVPRICPLQVLNAVPKDNLKILK